MKPLDPITLAYIREIAEIARGADPDDEQLVADTLEGETDLPELMRAAIREERELTALADAVGVQIEQLRRRQARLKEGRERVRQIMRDALKAAGLRRMTLPEATITLRPGGERVVIDDEAEVPTQLCRIVRKPDATAIKAALKAGEHVPGARLERGDDTIAVRVA